MFLKYVKNSLNTVLGREYRTLNLIEISREALEKNFNFFQKISPRTKISLVLKSNAYGHGLTQVGVFLDREIKPEFICVDSLYEAYELEKSGVFTKILIMGYTFLDNFKFRKINFHLPVFDIETLKFLNNYQPGINVHLKIDSGMNRLGIKLDELGDFVKKVKKLKKLRLKIVGIYSHLARADEDEGEIFCKNQINKFKESIKFLESKGFCFKYKHINATAGTVKFDDKEFNLSRVGIGFYGISPFKENTNWDTFLKKNIKQSLKLISRICQLKNVEKGEFIGYGKSFVAKKKMKIALLPLGYNEGINRNLSNTGFIKVKNNLCKIVGKICMNMTAVDVSEVKNVRTGEKVVVIDNDVNSVNSIKSIAKNCETIPYEVLVNLNPSIRRVLV